jgi:hypothetical protein
MAALSRERRQERMAALTVQSDKFATVSAP